MHLKSLTLRGFKSFASATTLRFEPGITCVVGPNGSGKSNVVDALTWVMGEQGAKSLRGGKMEDVIFAGTTGRPPLGRAEVSLTIDNADGALPIDYAEVTITRIMFRNGGSEYQINGDTCRLLDVQDLLSDSGIGREMHVIVGQGQLDSVLHADPAGRRAFIEEAAGVLKHRKRKEKALRKLDAMQANFARVQDLTDELRRQLKPLGRQAAVARRAAVIQADLRDARLRLLADELTGQRRALAAEIADEMALKERKEAAEQRLREAARAEAALEEEVRALAPRLRGAQQTWYELSQLAERVRGTRSLAEARIASAGSGVPEERRGRDPEDMAREAARIREQEAELEAALDAAGRALEDTVEHRAALERDLAAEERRLRDAARAVADRREGLARLHGQTAAARSRAAAAQAEIDRLTEAHGEAVRRAESAGEEHRTLSAEVAGLEAGDSELAAEHEGAVERLATAEAALAAARDALTAAERKRAALGARHEALALGLRRKDGSGAVLAAADTLGGVLGAAAELITVSPGFEVPVAAALGAAADAIAVDGPDTAAAALHHLRSTDAGRATLLLAPAGPSTALPDRTTPGTAAATSADDTRVPRPAPAVAQAPPASPTASPAAGSVEQRAVDCGPAAGGDSPALPGSGPTPPPPGSAADTAISHPAARCTPGPSASAGAAGAADDGLLALSSAPGHATTEAAGRQAAAQAAAPQQAAGEGNSASAVPPAHAAGRVGEPGAPVAGVPDASDGQPGTRETDARDPMSARREEDSTSAVAGHAAGDAAARPAPAPGRPTRDEGSGLPVSGPSAADTAAEAGAPRGPAAVPAGAGPEREPEPGGAPPEHDHDPAALTDGASARRVTVPGPARAGARVDAAAARPSEARATVPGAAPTAYGDAGAASTGREVVQSAADSGQGSASTPQASAGTHAGHGGTGSAPVARQVSQSAVEASGRGSAASAPQARTAVSTGGGQPRAGSLPAARSGDGAPPGGPGVPAADLVDGPLDVLETVRWLLRDIVVVPGLDDAAAVLAAGGDLTAVTAEGDVLGRRLAQGGSAGAPSLLEVQASVDEAAARLSELEKRCGELAGLREAAEADRRDRAAAAEDLARRLSAAGRERSRIGQDLGRLAGAARAAAGEAERSAAAVERAREALRTATTQAEELAERLAVAEDAAGDDEDPDTTARDRLAADGANARQTEMEARLQVRTHEERVRALAGRADALDRAARAEREARARAEQRRARLRHEAAVATAVADGAAQLLAHVEVSLTRAEQERAAAESARAAKESALSTARAAGRELKEELDKLTDSVHRGEVLGAEKRLRIRQLEERALEELGVEPDALLAEYGPDQLVPPSPPAEGETLPEDPAHPRNQPRPFRRAEQEKRLKAAERAYKQLGKVNPLALEEFAALEERHQFLSEQLEDLKKTRAELLGLIKEVDERVEQVFTEAFHDTAREFEGVFSRLFPGGDGRLVLTDPSDMLTTGVEVEARPPGKKVKRLSLLSGGERSLTAVALLVSIFKARPSPFYVMDEVEAALDDTNLQRLIRIMRELRDSSQLIVITHQKRTMEVADALYGVSMQGDGVSKVISQRLA
ncbi:AAA family ATPase [Streptomyces carpaticus]|uniref:Chromosome partition protein Smc n=1 Tax=Streptomyces carpaticus TaxID=285558 RepID=A0ABV4ZFG1_9ACTN